MPSLAIIPARSGSKGLPRKNIMNLAGHPLIAHTIKAAANARHIERIVVTTDDPEISSVARAYGAETPFMRPASLAGDTVSMNRVVLHCLQQLYELERYAPDFFTLLQPTCPLRTSRHIDEAIELALVHKQTAIVSVCPVSSHPYLMKKIENGKLTSAFPGTKTGRRQDLPKLYQLNGSIYVLPTSVFLQMKDIHRIPAVPYVMSARESVDIDTLDDFLYANWLMQSASTDGRSGGG